MAITSANRLELLQIAEAVAREKLIDPNLVIEAMEDSLGKAAKSRYGAEYDIRAHIDRKTGELTMERCRTVVPDEEYENTFDAELAKLELGNAGIECVIVGDNLVTNMVLGIPSIIIELQVMADDIEKAKQVLTKEK